MAAKGIRTKKIQEAEAQVVLESVKDLDLNKVVSEIGSLQVSVQETLASLTSTLTSKVQKVSQIDEAIQLKQVRLQELYGIEKEATSLDDLKAQREQEQAEWEADKAARQAEWSEEEETRAKQWEREDEEHEYTVNQARTRAQDEFDAEMAKARREQSDNLERLTKGWNEREAALKAKEQEFVALKAQVDGLDARIKSEVTKAEQIVGNTLKRQYDHEKALLVKDFEMERKLSEAKEASFTATIASLNAQIVNLEARLVQAHQDAKEVANQALASASGRQAMDAVQQVLSTKDVSTPTKTK